MTGGQDVGERDDAVAFGELLADRLDALDPRYLPAAAGVEGTTIE
jgi:hypothetical protein